MGLVNAPRQSARLGAWLLVAAALGATVVLGVRGWSLSECWRVSITEGRESPGLYAIWRVLHGHPLYEWPVRPPYSITLYNFGFYRAYAAILRVFGVDGEGLLAAPRLITLLGSVLGSVLFVGVASRLARPSSRLLWAGLVALSFVVWFGTQFVSWWALSVRPDVWAAALALGGLGMVLGRDGRSRGSSTALALASLVFFAAWTFKQSCVWTFASLVLGQLALRRLRAALWLAGPWSGLAVLSLLFGGEAYRYNILSAPAASAFRVSLMLENLSRAVPQNLWVFGCFPLGLALLYRGRLWQGFRELREAERLVIGGALIASVFGALSLGREGSNKNHLFEGYVLAALASWSIWVRVSAASAPQLAGRVAVLLLLPAAGMPVVQLFGVKGSGRIVLCSAEERVELSRLVASVAALPKPLYAEDELLSLPWHSTDDRYPALVVDATWYGIAEREGQLAPHLFQRLMASGRFRSAVLVDGWPDVAALRAQGVPCRPLDGTSFGLRFLGCTLTQAGPP